MSHPAGTRLLLDEMFSPPSLPDCATWART